MKLLKWLFSLLLLLTIFFSNGSPDNNNAGFFLPDSLSEMSLKFRAVDNLIILPVIINDSLKVNLILDTGCRNLVLFGKKFSNLLNVSKQKPVVFSGLGSGAPVTGYLSIGNRVSIESVVGKLVPVVVVAQKNLFSQYRDVDGVIGYDIFLKFEIEINSRSKTITFRKALTAQPRSGYSRIPLSVIDSRPILQSEIVFDDEKISRCDLIIDTGSSIGLLLKTTSIDNYNFGRGQTIIGRGLNGDLYGFNIRAEKLLLNGFTISDINAGIITSKWHNHASIGMAILKDYVVVLNYCKSYACFMKLS
jgi:hypothetical protein